MSILFPDDHALIRDLLGAKPRAWDRVVGRIADTVWTACRLLTPDENAARVAFSEVIEALRADSFRRLRPYDGSSRLETFTALLVREVLTERLLQSFQAGAAEGWGAFERFFRADIERIIKRRLPGLDREELRRDVYQDVSLALINDDCRRIKAYRGIGSFGGFILHTVDRLVIDSIRTMVPRRRELEVMPQGAVTLEGHENIPCDAATPEEALLAGENERLLAMAAQVLRDAMEALKEPEQVYLRIVLSGGEPLSAREIARQMRRPVEEIYKLRQRVMARLRETIERNPAVKTWRASV
jgi:RNA polymerase sigma factor (sigma-70 family)